MKDAHGHGSEARGGATPLDKRSKFGIETGAQFNRVLDPGRFTDSQRTVRQLRSQMQTAQGPGHLAALAQGVKNLLGGH